MSEPDFPKLAALLNAVSESAAEPLVAVRTLSAEIADTLEKASLEGAAGALEARRMHLLITDAASVLRYADARPVPNPIAALRWATRLTFASLLENAAPESATAFARAANAVLDKAQLEALPEDGIVYFVRARGLDEIKIGFAMKRNLANRLATFRTAMAHGCDVLLTIPGTLADEASLHERFAHIRVSESNEWFQATGELLTFIDSMQVPNGS